MLEDSGLKLRRTTNRSLWERDVAAQRERFEKLIDALRQGDVSALNRAWEVGTANEFYNHTGGHTPTTPDHQKDFIRRFHAFGLLRFNRDDWPVIPTLPTIVEFLATYPFARRPVKS